jgi:Protein kinase domain
MSQCWACALREARPVAAVAVCGARARVLALQPKLSARPQESPGALATLWVKPTDVPHARYVAVKGVDLQMSVDDLTTRCMAQLKRDVDPSRLTLRLIIVTGEEPTVKEEEEAKGLRPRLPLVKAGVADGCWLLVVLAPSSASSSPAKEEFRPPGEFSAPALICAALTVCSAGFRALLAPRLRGKINEDVMQAMLLRFANNMAVVETSEDALRLYEHVAGLPTTTTQALLAEQTGILLSGPLYQAMASTQSRLLCGAHVEGRPVVVKLLLGVADVQPPSPDPPFEASLCQLLGLTPWEGPEHPHFLVRTSAVQMVVPDSEVAMFCRHGKVHALVMPRYVLSVAELPQLSTEALVRGFTRLCCSLEYMHGLKLVHLDVKSANVLVTEQGQWLLADFGSCVREGSPILSCTELFHPTLTVRPTCGDFGQPSAPPSASPSVDWDMLLVMLLVEANKKTWKALLLKDGMLRVSKSRLKKAYQRLAGEELKALAATICARTTFTFEQ